MPELLSFTSDGIYCEKAGYYIDPWCPVDHAIITHAHSDHARIGNKHYLAHKDSLELLKFRLGPYIDITTLEYGETIVKNGVKISLHPAGHILGSAQVRLEYKGKIAVVSGDYKIEYDKMSAPFEQLKCHVFVTEATFGLPFFKWRAQEAVYRDIISWVNRTMRMDYNAIIYCEPLGKAQRILKGFENENFNIYAHHTIVNYTELYRQNGIKLPPVKTLDSWKKNNNERSIILLPLFYLNVRENLQIFQPFKTSLASGWMSIEAKCRKLQLEQGFVLSDNADWEELNNTVKNTGASKVYVSHGQTVFFAKWLQENNIDASFITTQFNCELNDRAEFCFSD